ncbi:MAG TPA: hypothetical protein VJ553_02230 [Candidatus Paceibacterota bacterium]|nr:hypothetical protein [Candidatus Paceibacterota bacterium]
MTTQEVARRLGLTESTIRNWTLATEAATAPVVPLPKTPGRHARQWPADEVLALEAALPDRELIRATGMCLHCLLRLVDREVLPAPRPPAWRDVNVRRWWPADSLERLRRAGWQLRVVGDLPYSGGGEREP